MIQKIFLKIIIYHNHMQKIEIKSTSNTQSVAWGPQNPAGGL